MKKLLKNPNIRLSKPKLRIHTYFKSLSLILVALITLHGCAGKPIAHQPEPISETTPRVNFNIAIEAFLTGDEMPSMEALAVQFGAQIAVDEINASGGMQGLLLLFCMDQTTSDFFLSHTDTSVLCFANGNETPIITVDNDFSISGLPQDSSFSLQAFHEKFAQMYGSEPDFYATSAYQCMYQLKQTLEQE